MSSTATIATANLFDNKSNTKSIKFVNGMEQYGNPKNLKKQLTVH